MKFLEIIREGLQEVNKNYQLIILHTLLLIVAFLLFFFIVGVPLIIVVTKMGLELPENGLSGLVEFFPERGCSRLQILDIHTRAESPDISFDRLSNGYLYNGCHCRYPYELHSEGRRILLESFQILWKKTLH